MKFADCLTSVMNGVRVRRKSWAKEKSAFVDMTLIDANSSTMSAPYTFTVQDEQADDWVIVVPKLSSKEKKNASATR